MEDHLDVILCPQVSEALYPIIIDLLFGPSSSVVSLHSRNEASEFHSLFFPYYDQQCTLIGRHAKGMYASVETYHDIIKIAQLLKLDLCKDEVKQLASDFLREADDNQHNNSINLAARLLCMIKFGYVPHYCGLGRHLDWSDGSLKNFVQSYFSQPPSRGHERIKLEKSFNAVNLNKIAGIEIWWTDNLADHLRMTNDDKAVWVFYYTSFLKLQCTKYAYLKSN
jgi:hypothetical protein